MLFFTSGLMTLRSILATYVVYAQISIATAAEAVPGGNTVSFVKGDNQRDTISLLISCLATLGLCVYTAVHLNLPAKKEGHHRKLWRELRWCIVGLFAPELVLYAAWRQLASTKQLCDEVLQARTEKDQHATESKTHNQEMVVSFEESDVAGTREWRHPWTLAHGFYATMGGIAIDLDDDDSTYAHVFGDAKRLTLTAKGVALLAHCGLLPDISLDDIKDKNKADSLAKLLVCVQAGWMIVQVISRSAQHLPTTLLEVHTVAHVVCALLMYAVWWHKPRQVASPTLLRGDGMWPLVAYMYSASRMSGQRREGILGGLLHATPEMKRLLYVETERPNAPLPNEIATDGRSLKATHFESLGHFVALPSSASVTRHQEIEPGRPEDEAFLMRQQLATEAVAAYPALRSRFRECEEKDTRSADLQHLTPYTAELVQAYSLNWPNAGLLRRTESLVMGMTLWGTSMAYGAIHVSAWHYFFPTYAERLLWHLSSVWITFCAAFWLTIHLLAYFFPVIDRIWVAFNDRRLGWLGTGVIVVLCTLCGVSFVGSRSYLVLEAFVSIRRVSEEVYDTPSWSQVFPHL